MNKAHDGMYIRRIKGINAPTGMPIILAGLLFLH